jgi:adenosylmethionine---8-amino-7-oxononanoate aminotransferase
MNDSYPIWHPFTQMKTAGMPLQISRGNGAFLYLEDGRQIVDCISSWWVTLHGHANAQIAEAIYEQAKKLEQVIFAGFTHEPSRKLADSLLTKLPPALKRVFFSDNGSTSVEVALKMAFQYWQNVGETSRTRFIGFTGGYHGDTIGAMSAGGSSPFWSNFKQLMFPIDVAPFPETWEGDTTGEEKAQQALAAIRTMLSEHPGEYAGLIIEPLIQGAAGMHMCTPAFLRSLKALAQEFNTLLIFDEVMTGFGRTGDWFAAAKADVSPDIICLSKGITGGFLPLSVTVCTERIYDAFLSDKLEKALFHSHSYTANPIACAAANASFDLLTQSESTFRNFEQRHRQMVQKHLEPLATRDNKPKGMGLEHFRFCGTIAAFDISSANKSYYSSLAPQLRADFLEKGVLLRPLGNTIYLMPPLCIDDGTLDGVYATIAAVLKPIFANASA